MLEIPGYTLIEKLHKGEKTLVFRAIRERDKNSVILKIISGEYPNEKDIQRLEKEYDIIKSLNINEIANAYAVEKINNRVMLVLEDAGGEALSKIIETKPFTIKSFLEMAIDLCDIIGKIHEKNIIHKDLKPENIIVNTQKKKIKIIDFSISSSFPKESKQKRRFSQVEGTLAYVSPEQTGWMNRLVDYRTDYYTLGITFYQMLNQRPPFMSDDPLELIHSHLAKIPEKLSAIHPEVPEIVSDIILKLLSKNAEDRYKSAAGIKFDLENCLKQLQKTGDIQPFVLGKKDVSSRFQIPQKVYGREKELSILMNAYKRVTEKSAEMIIISGEPGIGKSALVQEMYKPVVQHHGFFIKGKFQQFRKDIPYNAFIDAFEDLINQILTRSPEKVDDWKNKILKVLGPNAQIIINMIPRLELLIGEQVESAEFSSLELQNRFHVIFQNFVGVFATNENPLVLFIDDLQWADSSSLKLIEVLMTNPEFKHLLFIGTYRDQEMQENIFLKNTVKKIKEFRHEYSLYTGRELPLEIIHLADIGLPAVSQLVHDTLSCTKQEADELGSLIKTQTAGNPFFTNHFLSAIYNEGYIAYNTKQKKWSWDINKIKKVGFTNNVIQLMVNNMEKVSPRTSELLQLASCIGMRFDLKTLSFIDKKPVNEIRKEITEAIQEDYIYIVDEDFNENQSPQFQFQHDQILSTAYSMIEQTRKKKIHLKIGQLLIEKLPEENKTQQVEDLSKIITNLSSISDYLTNETTTNTLLSWLDFEIFSIINHINIGLSEIKDKKEIIGVIILNLLAAKKARKSAAFESALEYLNIAQKILPEESWQSHYFLTLQLYTEAAECEYINTNFVEAEKLCKIIVNNAKSVLDKVKVYEITIASLTPQNKFNEAIESGRSALLSLGVKLPKKPTELSPLPDLVSVYVKTSHRIENLINLAPMKDPEKLAAMNLMIQLITPSFISAPNLFPVLVLKMVQLTLKYGLSNQSACAFAFFGMILGSGMGKFEPADKLANLAIKVLDLFPPGNFNCKVLFVSGNMIRHWMHSLIEGQSILEQAYISGLDSGDLLFASYSLNWFNAYNYLKRKNLADTLEEMKKNRGSHEKIKQKDAADFYSLWMQFVANLSDNENIPLKIKGVYFNEDTSVNVWNETKNDTDLFTFNLMKGIMLYLKKSYKNALTHLKEATAQVSGVFGMPVVPEHNLFYSLTLAALAKEANPVQKQAYIKKITTNQKKLKVWAANAPMNYKHKYLLVSAELDMLRNRPTAVNLYEQAIASAMDAKFTFEQALANELLADYYFKQKKVFIAQAYIRECYYLYHKWGCMAKINELEDEYPEIVSRRILGSTEIISSTQMTTKSSSQTIDFKTVLKVSQNISSEIDLGRLTEKLILIAIENAGAEKGFLVLEKEGHLFIVAEGKPGLVNVIADQPVESFEKIALGVVNYVKSTGESVVINDTNTENQFHSDPYIIREKPKSLLCLPVLKGNKLLGILYLENNLMTNVFTRERLDILNLLTTQAIISLENAMYVDKIKTINAALEEEIIEHKNTENDLILTKERYALAAKGANDGLWDWDLNNDKIYFSPRWKSMLGFKEDEIMDFTNEWFSRVHEDDIAMLRSSIDTHLEGINPHLECEYRMKHKNGQYLWMITRGLAVRDSHETPYRMAGSQTEITKRKIAEEQLRHDALHDSLTNLPNWNLLLDRLSHAIKRKKRQPNYLFAALFLDIDRFKVINESLGHELGNSLLILLAESLQQCLRAEDTVARLGGDEFGILLESIEDINDAIQIIKKIRKMLHSPFKIEGHELVITVSIGMVTSGGDYTKPEDMLRDADTAMHRAKTQGRNKYEIFDKTMHAHVMKYLNTENELRKALEKHEFETYFQPIVSASDGKIIGAETLLRWIHDKKEIISPLDFIPIAEENGLIVPIGEWVILEACKQAQSWVEMGLDPIPVAVNLSGRQFGQKNLLEIIDDALSKTGLKAEFLQFELTESVLMDNTGHAIEILAELKSKGIKTSIDDFGTGYSSLNYLKQFPVEKLKIDKSFVQNMVTNASDAALIKAIIAMGASMGMKVIAEGVETVEQLKFLQNENCDEIQGFYFSKPLSSDKFAALYKKNRYFPLDKR